MQNEFRERHRKTSNNMRMARDITMAVLILAMALVLFFAPKLNLLQQVNDTYRVVLGALFALYGIFRLYRGLKRDY